MNGDVLEALAAVCSGDWPHQGPPAWSPLWGQWLCPNCRAYLTDAELRMPLSAGKKPVMHLPGDAVRALLCPSRSTGTTRPWTTC